MQRVIKALASAGVAFGLMGVGAHDQDRTVGFLVKSFGNGFFDAAHKGADNAAKEVGDTNVIYTGPTKATAEGQIEIINSLIDQKVGCIAISANDPDAVAPALKKAMDRGI